MSQKQEVTQDPAIQVDLPLILLSGPGSNSFNSHHSLRTPNTITNTGISPEFQNCQCDHPAPLHVIARPLAPTAYLAPNMCHVKVWKTNAWLVMSSGGVTKLY